MTCTVEGASGHLLPPPGWREFGTLSWRFWVAEGEAAEVQDGTALAQHLVIVTAEPDCLEQVASVVADVLRSRRTCGPKAVRLAKSPEVLRELHGMPHWAGRAVTVYLTDEHEQLEMARELDLALATRGLSGPPCLRGRPYGGQSGLVFLAGDRTWPSAHRTDPLTTLRSGALA